MSSSVPLCCINPLPPSTLPHSFLICGSLSAPRRPPPLSPPHTHTLSHTYIHIYSHSLSLSQTHTHTHTHTRRASRNAVTMRAALPFQTVQNTASHLQLPCSPIIRPQIFSLFL